MKIGTINWTKEELEGCRLLMLGFTYGWIKNWFLCDEYNIETSYLRWHLNREDFADIKNSGLLIFDYLVVYPNSSACSQIINRQIAEKFGEIEE